MISPIEDIVEDARNGRMFILVDAHDRENEGDLVIPAQFATPANVNFMAKEGRGLICLALAEERVRELGLPPMAARNSARMQTAFTVSIEAKEGITTGISAHDRAHTIAVAIDPSKGAADIVSPGHVFPLCARPGGVLVRAGHTEASVDVARIAGLIPAAVICEIMTDDGSMARLDELEVFAAAHGLKIGAIADLIAHRLIKMSCVERVQETSFAYRGASSFRLIVFRNRIDGVEHAALVRGTIDPQTPVLVRVHRLDTPGDALASVGARGEQFQRALDAIEREGRGVIVLLRDFAPDWLTSALNTKRVENGSVDVIGVGSQILRELGVQRMILLAGAPQKLVGLEGYGLSVEQWRTL